MKDLMDPVGQLQVEEQKLMSKNQADQRLLYLVALPVYTYR